MIYFLKIFLTKKACSVRIESFVLAVVLLFMVSGCGAEEDSDVTVSKASKAVSKDVVEEAIEEIEEVKKEEWTSVEVKSNPFATFIRVVEAGSGEPSSPLECCDLMQFKISIILSGSGIEKPYATVKTPSNKKLIVNEGMYMGLNRGKVVKINRDGITVKEPISDKTGKTVDYIEILLPMAQGR